MKLRYAAIPVLLIVGAAVSYSFWKRDETPGITYREIPVERGNIDRSILATGSVAPENRLEIKPPIAGRVEQVLIAEGQKVKKGQLLAWMSSTERAAMLDAARSKGPEELKRWEEMYRPTPVLAPISGTIILRNVESGQTFTSNDPVFVMSDRLTVKAQVDETDIAQIHLKQSAQIVLDSYPDKKVAGKVDQIAFDATTVNNVTVYLVDVLPDSTPAYMRSGMTANVTFLAESKQDVLIIPTSAIQTKDKKTTVLVPGPGRKPAERAVQTGLTDGKKTEIVSGLTEGEPILSAELKIGDGKGAATSNPLAPAGRRRSASR